MLARQCRKCNIVFSFKTKTVAAAWYFQAPLCRSLPPGSNASVMHDLVMVEYRQI